MLFLNRYLQPPSYLYFQFFGLDISDRSFKFIALKKTLPGPQIERYGTEDLPEGLVKAGVITNVDDLAKILKQKFADTPIRHVTLALPEEKGFVRTIHMPRIPPEEQREALSLQLDEHIPLPSEEISFTHHVLPGHDPKTMDVLIAAFPTPLLETYKRVVEQADLIPLTFEIESQAIARAVIPPTEQTDVVLVIDIGHTRTSFLFAQNGYTQFTSTLPIGGLTMHEYITKALQVNETDAEQLKIQHGLSQTEKGKAVYDALLPLIQIIANEAMRRAMFWRNEMTGHKETKTTDFLRHVYLCGREANLIGLPRHLSFHLNAPVSLANVWVNMVKNPSYIPEIEFRESLGYATSVGLALGNTQEV
jgi:type IV pilus assembly protein PilM